MAISFTKTTWVDLSSPYIDASQLNRIETVLDALVNGSSRAVWRDGDTMTGALTLSAGNLNVGAGAIQTAGVTRISAGGAGSLTTLSTTGLADMASARVQNLTASQIVATDGSKNLVSWDPLTARTNLGIAGAELINRSLKSVTGSGWLKLATVRVSAISHYSTFMAEVVSVGRSTSSTDDQFARLYVRLKQNSALADGVIDIMQCEYTSAGGNSFTFGYSVVQNDTAAKVVDIYVYPTSSTHYVKYSVLGSGSNSAPNAPVFYDDPAPVAVQPTPWVGATLGAVTGGVASFTNVVVTDPTTGQTITGQSLTLERAGSTNDAFFTRVTGDAVNRFRLSSGGLFQWGDGTNARDTTLYRSAAAVLKTDGAFDAGAIQTEGVTRISSGGAGSLTTLSTTGLATLAQATVSDLTTGRMVSTTTGGRLQALDAAGSRALIGAQHRNEAVNVTVTYPGPNSGYFLLGTTAEAAIPAARLVEGLVVRIKALADVSVDSGVYFSLIGALSNASTGIYPDTYDSATFGGPIGRWPGFLSGKILFTVEIRLGAITSGTTRLVHYVWSAQADGLAPIFWADGNYPLDVSIPRYPHLAVDLAGNGSINKYVYSVEIQDP